MPVDKATCESASAELIERTFPHNKKVSEQYADPQTLDYVRALIPHEVLQLQGPHLVRGLLDWFKADFMRWLPSQMRCEFCTTKAPDGAEAGTVMQVTIEPGSTWQLRKVERYKCPSCGAERVYPRYSDVRKIAEYRLGRCGEWSILFGAVLNAASLRGRIVHDFLDHCWNEALVDGHWMHLDSTLQYPTFLDHPYHYERNWGKQYTFVIGFEPDTLQDVTLRYTEHWQTVLQRREKFFGLHDIQGGGRMAEENLQRLYSSIR
ncbi:MAG: transglutaminase domain-containing protein [Nitrososphaera sp.]